MTQVTRTLDAANRIRPLIADVLAEFGPRATARGLFAVGVSILTSAADRGEAMAELRLQLGNANVRARGWRDRQARRGAPGPKGLPEPPAYAGGKGAGDR